jgi:hypothetical protein
VGPITIPLLLPTLPVPPLLIMFRGVNFEPPGLVVCPLPAVGGSLNGLLTTLGDALVKLDLIERMLKRVSLPLPLPYAGVASALQLVLKLLGSPAMRVLSTREEPNLNVYDLMLGVVNDLEAEDELRSLVYVGLPGPTVDLYPKRDFQPGSNNRFLRLGVTGEMAAQGRLVVSLSDLNERSVPGVLHPADMQHTLFWRDASSFRFQRV